MTTNLRELVEWLQNEAEEGMKQAISRQRSAGIMRCATTEELREAKIIAEKMHGRKLPGVSATTEAAQRSAQIDEIIADKLVIRARLLSAWADLVVAQEREAERKVLEARIEEAGFADHTDSCLSFNRDYTPTGLDCSCRRGKRITSLKRALAALSAPKQDAAAQDSKP